MNMRAILLLWHPAGHEWRVVAKAKRGAICRANKIALRVTAEAATDLAEIRADITEDNRVQAEISCHQTSSKKAALQQPDVSKISHLLTLPPH